MNDRYLTLVQAKNDAHGIDKYEALSHACSNGMRREYKSFLNHTRYKLWNVPRETKKYKSLSILLWISLRRPAVFLRLNQKKVIEFLMCVLRLMLSLSIFSLSELLRII